MATRARSMQRDRPDSRPNADLWRPHELKLDAPTQEAMTVDLSCRANRTRSRYGVVSSARAAVRTGRRV